MHSPTLSTAVRRIRAMAVPLSDQLSDRDLLARFLKSSDESAFAALVARHGPSVLGVCRRILSNAHDAEDAFQATFLVLARRAASIRNTASVGCWLHGVAFRVAHKLRTRRSRQASTTQLPDVPAPSQDDVSWREVRRVLDEELHRLPERLRLPVFLCYFDGKTRDEAADSLGWKLTTLRGRLEDGRERLRLRLARRGIELSAALLAISAATEVSAFSDEVIATASQAAKGHASAAACSLAKGMIASNNLGKLAISATMLAVIGLGTTLFAFRGQAGDKPGSGPKPPDPPAKKNELPKELLALMNAADRVWVVDEPTDQKPIPEPAEVLKGMSPPAPGFRFEFKVEALKDLPRKGHRWIVFLKSIDEIDHIPKITPLPTERWFVPADDGTIAALREYIPPCEWGDASSGLRLGLHARVADEPTVEVVMQNTSDKDIRIQQLRGNYWDDWSHLTFTVTGPDGKAYTMERVGPPLKDGDAPRDRVLKAGERYIHVVRLNRWLMPPDRDRGFDLPRGNAPAGLFATGGDFKVQATYKLSDGRDPPHWWIGKIESKPVTVTVPKLGVFGEPAGDFHLRLRPPSAALRVGDLPELLCDLKYTGKEKREVHLAPDFAAVELDGKWYQCGRDGSIEGRVAEIAPNGELLSCLDVRPDSNWIHLRDKPNADDPTIKEAVQFQLKEGRHTVRVAYTLAKNVRAISNAITIDVAGDGWGEPASGVKARLRMTRTRFVVGDALPFELDLKNTGRKTWTLSPIPFSCMVEIDGRWFKFLGDLDNKAQSKDLKPGDAFTPFVTVKADGEWKANRRPEDPIDEKGLWVEWMPFALPAGKHKVRVGFPVDDNKVFPISNPVEIEVDEIKIDAKTKALALAADQIWVVNAPTRDKPIPTAEQILKGPKSPDSAVVFDLRLLPGDDPKKKFIVFLTTEQEGKSVPVLQPGPSPQWHCPYSEELAHAIRKVLLPDEWGEEKSGMRMGLRLRDSNVFVGKPVVAEVVMQNNGKQDWKLEQHRFNIYDYWPNTHFKVKTPDGITLELRRQVGAIREDDNPRIITLKPGETYVHVMQLDLWPAHTNWVDTSKPVRDLFAKAGEYMISAHYHYAPPVGLATWTAEFASTTVKLNVEKPDEWGAAAEGIKARLRLAKPTFKAGDSLEFELDLKNTGNIAIEDTPIPFHCNIELDGNWYAYTKPIGYPAATIKLGPGRERVPHVKVTANKDWVFPAPWTDTGGPTPFELKAGKHKVRIGYPLPHVDSEKIKNSMVLSQVVEFEVGAGGKVPEPTLADAADRIVVATIDWKDGKPRLKPVRAIKGPNNRWQPEVQPITIAEGDEPLPADKPNQEWVLFLRAEEDEVEAPKLSPAAAKGWFRPADADEIKRVVAALPTLKETGPVKKNVSLGLRPSVTTVHVGDPIRLDVVLTNYGDAALRLLQLRYNVYDYWPLLAFTITLPDGKKVVLTRPDGVFKREDYVDEMELKKGESYSHTVRIDRWRVAGPQLREEIVLEALFRLPGTYKVEATYAATAGFKNINPTTEILDWPFWSGELLSNAATFEVKAAAKK